MKKNNLLNLIGSFHPPELREVRKFLVSPFFNQREDLVQLFDFLEKNKEAGRPQIWEHLYGAKATFDDQKTRLLMSYLHRLIEQYIAVRELSADERNNRLHVAIGYRRRGMAGAFERTQKALSDMLEKHPLRDTRHHEISHQLLLEEYRLSYADHPDSTDKLQVIAEQLDITYLSQKLKHLCMQASHQTVYQADYRSGMEVEIIDFAERSQWLHLPAIAAYLHGYRMLQNPEDETHFQQFKKIVLASNEQLPEEEMRGLYRMAINYCIKQLNQGEEQYFAEVIDLYKPGIESRYLLENGVLSRFTYHNVVAAALRTDELDWAHHFIHKYKNALERSYRESSFSFNLARLEYTRRQFNPVLDLLQKANYRDPLLNLAAKTLLMKTYYELAEYDLLQSHLDAMRNYIRRKRVIGYHKKNYLNIVRFAEKLLKINMLDKKVIEKLREVILKEEVLTEKEWLLENLE